MCRTGPSTKAHAESSKTWLTGKFAELRLLLDEEEALARKFIDKNTQLALQVYREQVESCREQMDVVDELSNRVWSISQEPDAIQLLQAYLATEQELQRHLSLGELSHPEPLSFEPVKSLFKGLADAVRSALQTPLDVRLKESKWPGGRLQAPLPHGGPGVGAANPTRLAPHTCPDPQLLGSTAPHCSPACPGLPPHRTAPHRTAALPALGSQAPGPALAPPLPPPGAKPQQPCEEGWPNCTHLGGLARPFPSQEPPHAHLRRELPALRPFLHQARRLVENKPLTREVAPPKICAHAHARPGHDARAPAPLGRPPDRELRAAGPPGTAARDALRRAVAGAGPRLLRRRPPLLGGGRAGGGRRLVGGRGLRLPVAPRGLGRRPPGLQPPVLVPQAL
nr:tripartite motif-containing protein 14 isoform X3 [Oryctolagus cuniculus]